LNLYDGGIEDKKQAVTYETKTDANVGGSDSPNWMLG
jgi:hypothetical protein